MQQASGERQYGKYNSTPRDSLTRALFGIAMVAGALATWSPAALAQTGKFGAYTGTINVSGTATGPSANYRAVVKIALPVTSRNADTITAEFLAGEAPNASVQIAQWDESHKASSPDSDGKYSSWTCTLAKPVELAMTPTGVLEVDLRAKKHMLSLTLLATKDDVAFNCVNSRSGAYKKKKGLSLYIGTGAPGMQNEAPQPFIDAANLSARYTLKPSAGTGFGQIDQQWDFRLTR